MFQSNSKQNLWVNFLSFYRGRKRFEKVEKIYVPHFLISKKNHFFFPDLINNFNLLKKKAIINWVISEAFFCDSQFKPNFCNCEIESSYLKVYLKEKITLKLLFLVCKFIKFLLYSILIKKIKTNSHKRVNKDFCEPVKSCCFDSILIVKKMLKKFSNSKVLSKLEKNGSIKIVKKKLRKVNYITFQLKNFQDYNKKLKYYSQFSKLIYLQ